MIVVYMVYIVWQRGREGSDIGEKGKGNKRRVVLQVVAKYGSGSYMRSIRGSVMCAGVV